MRKLIPWAAIIAILLTLGYGWYRTEIARAEARGEVRLLRDQLDSATVAYDAFVDSVAREDSLSDARLRAALIRHARQEDELEAAHAASLSRIEGLETLLARAGEEGAADTTTDEIRETVVALQAEVGACRNTLRSCDDINAELHNQVGRCGLRVERCEAIVARQRDIIEKLKAVPEKNTLIPWAIAGASVTLLVLDIVFGR